MTLEDFLAQPIRNAWLHEPGIEVYVRKGWHCALGMACECLDVANIEVDENSRRQGVFKTWLKKAELLCPFDYVYVENVHNPILDDFLMREGYWYVDGGSYIKRVKP